MKSVFESETGMLHAMGHGHLEAPIRLSLIKEAIEKSALKPKFKTSPPASFEDIYRVHSKHLVEALIESSHHERTEFTPDTIANKYTWNAALHAAGGSIQAAIEAYNKKGITFAMLRPPGHHATVNAVMGFCFLNNIAIAAEALFHKKKVRKIAIVDVDNHHGNGTQDIFYHRSDVLYTSLHASPRIAYPGTGWIEQVGEGEGIGKNVNIPLPLRTEDDGYLVALNEIVVPIVKEFDPDILLISLGLDGLRDDPYGALGLSTTGFFKIGQSLASIKKEVKGRVAVFLEGGYKYAEIGEATVKFFEGLEQGDKPQFDSSKIPEQLGIVLKKAKGILRNYWTNL